MPIDPMLVVVGPTASGKSAVAARIARSLRGEIISADSMQVYRGMDIGTAKPSPADRDEIPHHMIDVADLTDAFDVFRFQREAAAAAADVRRRGGLPIIVGGTGLYVRSVIDELDFPPRDDTGAIRADLEVKVETSGEDALREELRAADPQSERSIERGNLRRLIRALEVVRLTGQPFSRWTQAWQSYPSERPVELIGLEHSRDELYRRIDERVDRMMAAGFLAEVESLASRGYRDALTALQGLGYKELLDVLDGHISLDEAVSHIKQSTRRYAKRQMTWFRRDPRVHWIDVTGLDDNESAASVEGHMSVCPRAQQFLTSQV